MVGEPYPEYWDRFQQGLHSQANQLQWALRNFLSWSPGVYREKPAGQYDLAHFSQSQLSQANALIAKYGLENLPQRASQQRLLETLTYLDWLDMMAQEAPDWWLSSSSAEKPNTPRWLDVGAKNWSYVEALANFAQATWGEHFQLDGVELDPHRRYTNGQTRGQAAKAFIQSIPQAQYHVGDIQQWQQPAEIISLFLPFVFEEPLLAWGLPLNFFQPQALLDHVIQRLSPDGVLILVNQGAVEAEAQAELLQQATQKVALEIKSLGQLPARFIEYQYPRFGWLCRKAI